MLFLDSCGKFTPPVVKNIGLESNLNITSIYYSLEGTSNEDFIIELRYKNNTVYSSHIKDGFASDQKSIQVSKSALKKYLLPLYIDYITFAKIEFEVLIYNSANNYRYDTTFTIAPTVMTYPQIELLNDAIAESKPVGIDNTIFKVREYLRKNKNKKELKSEKIALQVLNLSKENVEFDVDKTTNIPIYGPKKKILLRIQTDKKFDLNFVFFNNESTNLETLKDSLASLPLSNIPNNCSLKRKGAFYQLTTHISVSENHQNGIINVVYFGMNENGESYIQNLGKLIIDNVAPTFSRINNFGSFVTYSVTENTPKYKHDDYTGSVTLTTKKFQGWSPFKVPFVGQVYGDVKELYVNGLKRKFKIGEELYFKQKIYLDTGYNRIPIKIVDKRGNVAVSYIEVTLSNIKDSEININNEINIDNN